MSDKTASLLSYVIDYLTEERARALSGENPDAIELIQTREQVNELVNDAIEAYEGGAR